MRGPPGPHPPARDRAPAEQSQEKWEPFFRPALRWKQSGRPPGAGARKRPRREGHKPQQHARANKPQTPSSPRRIRPGVFGKGIGGAQNGGHPIVLFAVAFRRPTLAFAPMQPPFSQGRKGSDLTAPPPGGGRRAVAEHPSSKRFARTASSRPCAAHPASCPGGHHSPSAHRARPFVTRARARPSGPQPTWRSVRHGSQRVKRQGEDTGGCGGRG